MKFIKTREENIEENYLELHYDTIDEETKAVLDRLELPERLTADALLDVLNSLMSREEFYRLEC